MLPHRRHRKSASATQDSPSRSPGGFSSIFNSRRRWGKATRETNNPDTLLPTTFSTKQLDRTSINCNSFLMGGHYYPGKDKKRRHMRRKTLWYKLFCSSPWKRTLSFFITSYLAFFYGLVPLGEWLVQVGSWMSPGGNHGSNTNWLQYDSTLEIPPLRNEQLERLQVESERSRLQFGSPQRNRLRLDILEEIVPKWYHRNDMVNSASRKDEAENGKGKRPTSTKKEKTHSHQKKGEKIEKSPSKRGAAKPHNSSLDHPSQHSSMDSNKEDERRLNEVRITNNSEYPFRKLENMDSYAAKYTSCSSGTTAEVMTTLVVQTSISRLWIMNESCSRWKDPIIAVVFVPDDERVPKVKLHCPNVQLIFYEATEEESAKKAYPVNRLRNIGLDAVKTSHVLMVDVDFLPSQDLDGRIREVLEDQVELQDDRQALVVPAFERIPPEPCTTEESCTKYLQSDDSFLPHSFEDLQGCVKRRECQPFQSSVSWDSHSSTQSKEWIQRNWYIGEEQHILRSVECFHSARYEPYVVLQWCHTSLLPGEKSIPKAPYYDERFHGYGKNKIELVSHLRKTGYRFRILPEGFIIHNPHPESAIKEEWIDVGGSDLHASMDKLYAKFMAQLDHKYKEFHDTMTKICKRPQ
mmetsp:Transcript_18857/g.46718  ORF Transcript_18857/g.46718 Transcript_18857/m.46718 type:complete len:635 (+) Transcript_18857:73-1977(+)